MNDKTEKPEEHIDQDGQEEKEEVVYELPEIDEAERSEILEEAEKSEEAESSFEIIEQQKKELSELNDKYLRLYSELENYKRLRSKEKEELIKYSNEELLRELLSVIDHLELALQHSETNKDTENSISALIEGVELTLKELRSTLEKFGLAAIEALGKTFDPFVHHAMTQVETDESEANTVVNEFRKGYMLKDRVLRPAYVAVSKKPSSEAEPVENEENGKPERSTDTNNEKIEIEEE
jgi:molecular chaperone GrpE